MMSAILSLILVTTTFVAHPAPEVKRAALNQEFEIKLDEAVAIENSGLKINFIEVAEDSRCPENVKCVWAGNGKVVLLISMRGRVPGKVNLNTMLDPKHDAYRGYDIKLVKLDPYPKDGATIKKGDYVATLVVSRR